ncbi:Receptor-like cytosolic serine/threonine-protein kinase RBK2 [Platanthera zijinensis]|uniref:Receptor-like cytosolic serine/threonine-protein kinase RBK2 n=1 Tax=Platanthera zijinensis TaxID=2320716 RepID=A0AAP0BA46_9ASPA
MPCSNAEVRERVEEGERYAGKTLVVGMKMDGRSRELLTWALVNAANAGDRVIAMHVIRSAAKGPETFQKPSSLISIVKALDNVLAVYEGFCNLKQVALKLKICRGSSVRKVLVHESSCVSASKLIVGSSKNSNVIVSSSISVAQFCAKKLPGGCLVLAVNNGKIIFQKEATGCASIPNPEFPDRRPGWLLLRSAVLNPMKNSPPVKLVRWASRLPRRCSASSVVHPDLKQAKADLDEKSEAILSRIQKFAPDIRLFSFDEVVQATSNFSSASCILIQIVENIADNIIGRGGSCKVYRSFLADFKELAFKSLTCCDGGMLEDFISEIEIITNLNHKNIISLYGFCFENNHLVLVYDLLSKGSLEESLHGVKGKMNNLSWADRFKIGVGVAEALDYLHSGGFRESVIHRDVKSSNILLTDDFEPKLCDFGLAQWASSSSIENGEEAYCGDLAGTFGYLAPEYFMSGKIDEKIDVYAFGVVLLELLSGRKPVSTGCPKGEESLAMWAKPILLSGEYHQLVDPSLGENYNNDEMERMCLAASLCISQASRSRPSSSLALKLLKGEGDVVEWAKSELISSTACEDLDDDALLLHSNIQSHINLALLDLDEDELSSSSVDHSVTFVTSNTSMEEYLKARCC